MRNVLIAMMIVLTILAFNIYVSAKKAIEKAKHNDETRLGAIYEMLNK